MLKSTQLEGFVKVLFEREEWVEKATAILQAILEARSPRLSDLARQMPGNALANYKRIQRFLKQVDLKEVLLRLFQPEAPFVLADVTEMPRPHAYCTPYVGRLQDGKTRGYWLLLLATPFRGRAIPCHFITYSSRTLAQEKTSRNLEHRRAFAGLKALLGEKPLVLDREFSYLELLRDLVAERVHFVIRLQVGSQLPRIVHRHGWRLDLSLSPGQEVIYHHVLYKGQVVVNLIGVWRRGFAGPLWVMSDLDPRQALHIYQQRMKIEESFKDLKSLLGITRLMNKQRLYLEQMIALVLMAYAIGLWIGEALRDRLYGDRRDKWSLYSGLFLLLKQKVPWSSPAMRALLARTLHTFQYLVGPPVRSFV